MKVFYIILVVFLLTICSVFLCGAQIKHFAEESTSALEMALYSQDDETLESIQRLSGSISDRIKKFEFAIPHGRTDAIKDYADLLVIRLKSQNEDEFYETKQLLINELNRAAKAERITLEGIF